jgi:hypothetical protein
VRYDAYYAANLGLWLDLRLIAVTAVKVVGLVAVTRALLRVPGAERVEPVRAASDDDTEEMACLEETQTADPPQADLSRA